MQLDKIRLKKIKGDAKSAKLKKAVEAELKVVFVLGNPFEAEVEVQQKIKKSISKLEHLYAMPSNKCTC